MNYHRKKEEKAQKIKEKKQKLAENRAIRNEKKEKIVLLRCEGKKMQEIADIMGCTKQYISSVLQQKRKEI